MVGPFLSLLTPLPFVYYVTKLGFHRGLQVAALAMAAMVLTAGVMGHPQLILFGVEFVSLGLFLAVLFSRKMSTGRTICLATGLMLLLSLALVFFLALSREMNIGEVMVSYLDDHLKATIKSYQQMGLTKEQALELEGYGRAVLDILRRIYPSLVIVGTGFAVWINVAMAKLLFRYGKLEYPDPMPMDRWQAPDHLVWGVIFSGFALFVISGTGKWVAINVLIVAMAVYLFQGLSILFFFLNKYHVPTWMRVGIYFLIAVQQVFFALMALVGLFDQWIDFRKIHKRRNR